MKVVVLGASGMLGSMVLDYLARGSSEELVATARSESVLRRLQATYGEGIEWHLFDAADCTVESTAKLLSNASWAINAIGIIKPYIHDDHALEVQRAVVVNALFPHLLAQAAERTGCRVLQIATDCVFSGGKGHYLEKDGHDPLDVYGKTKSLGEVFSPNVHHLRCSIIGPEPKGHVSLLDWFLGQARDGEVGGYTNQRWNGVTTLHFARLCQGVMRQNLKLPHVQHIIPDGTVSKAELLQCFAREYGRHDITIIPTEAKTVIDRTVGTMDDPLNGLLWASAGYAKPPSIPQMVAEMARFEYRLKGG